MITATLALERSENKHQRDSNTLTSNNISPQVRTLSFADRRGRRTGLEHINGQQNAVVPISNPGPIRPALFSGSRCYTDASFPPDDEVDMPRKAGLGIFILDPAKNLKVFIKAQVHNCTSVLMGEAIALSLAAAISARLQMEMVNFFTDNLVLERFLNGDDLESPPRLED
jgi:hypothetical protein